MSILNKQRIREDFSNAAKTYDAAAVVQEEICARALERLQMLNLQADSILDIGSGTGTSTRGLRTLFSDSKIIACDFALPMLQQNQHFLSVCSDAEHLAIKDASIDLIFSTSTFQWCEDLAQVFSECSRVLKKEGVLVFTTFGPDTLMELRQSWAQVDSYDHVHMFIDMHDIGDMLLAQQYSDPVVDREMIMIEYEKFRQLLHDLKATGSRGKFVVQNSKSLAGLTGKAKFIQLESAYERLRLESGLLPASYEVIYGYARKAPSQDPTRGEIRIPVDNIKL